MRYSFIFTGFALTLGTTVSHAATVRQSNPLYIPKANTFYSQSSVGSHDIQFQDGTSGDGDMYHVAQTIGYGATDRFSVSGQLAYTHNDDENRSGVSISNLTALYRALPSSGKSTMDLYGTFDFEGSRMYKGVYINDQFVPTNYSTGRHGIGAGFRTGKTDGVNTLVGYGEVMYRYGKQKSRITDLTYTSSDFTAEYEDSIDWVLGIKTAYETTKWAWNFDVSYRSYDATVVTDIDSADAGLRAAVIGDQQDNYREWVFSLSGYYSLASNAQVGLYTNYINPNYEHKNYETVDYTLQYGLLLNIEF